MAKVVGKLTALAVSRATKPGVIGDGGGLYLQVSASGTKSWIFRFTMNGKSREMGLGPLHTITLADARKLASEARKLTLAGVDPIAARQAERQTAALAAAKAINFQQCAEQFIATNQSAWRSEKHA